MKVTFFWTLGESFAGLFLNDNMLLPPLCTWRMKKTTNPMIRRIGAHEYRSVAQETVRCLRGGNSHVALNQLLDETLVLRWRVSLKSLAVGQHSGDLVPGEHDALDLPGVDPAHKFR